MSKFIFLQIEEVENNNCIDGSQLSDKKTMENQEEDISEDDDPPVNFYL